MKTCFSAVAVAAVALVLVGAATARSSRAGGRIEIWVPNPAATTTSKIVVTGAIGDYGTTIAENAHGKADPNGNYEKVVLRDGTFVANTVAFAKKADAETPKINMATCSGYLTVSAAVPLDDGTGAYTGIHGSLTVTESFAFILPRFASGAHKGHCNGSNIATPLASFASLSGSGTVSFG